MPTRMAMQADGQSGFCAEAHWPPEGSAVNEADAVRFWLGQNGAATLRQSEFLPELSHAVFRLGDADIVEGDQSAGPDQGRVHVVIRPHSDLRVVGVDEQEIGGITLKTPSRELQ